MAAIWPLIVNHDHCASKVYVPTESGKAKIFGGDTMLSKNCFCHSCHSLTDDVWIALIKWTRHICQLAPGNASRTAA